MNNKLKALIVLVGVVALAGCAAGMGENFSCTAVGGEPGCTSMDEVRSNLGHYAQGGAGISQTNKSNAKSTIKTAVPVSFTDLPRRNRNGEPTRTEDVVRKVTIFPFVDKSGNYVDTTDIYIILDDSRWTGRPAPAIWKD